MIAAWQGFMNRHFLAAIFFAASCVSLADGPQWSRSRATAILSATNVAAGGSRSRATAVSSFAPSGVATHAGYAYAITAASNGCRIAIVDLSVRGVFRPAAEIPCGAASCGDPAVSGDVLFVPFADRVELYDVCNPEAPSHICHLDASPIVPLRSIAEEGAELVLDGAGGRLVFDVEDPFSPVPRAAQGLLAPAAAPMRPAASGNLVVYARPCATNPAAGEFVSARICADGEAETLATLPSPRPCVRLSPGPATNVFLFADGVRAGLLGIDADGRLSDLGAFFETNAFASAPLSVAFDPRGLAVVACRSDGIRVFSLGTNAPSTTLEVTCRQTQGDARDVRVSGDLVGVADGTRGIGLYRIDDVGLISPVGDYALAEGSAAAVFLVSNAVYCAGEETLLCGFATDVPRRSAPRLSPREPGQGGCARDAAPLAVSDAPAHAVVADGIGGIAVVDLSGGRPRLAGRLGGKELDAVAVVALPGGRVAAQDAEGELVVLSTGLPAAEEARPCAAAPSAAEGECNPPGLSVLGYWPFDYWPFDFRPFGPRSFEWSPR